MTTRPDHGGYNKNEGRSPDLERKGHERVAQGQPERKAGGMEDGEQEGRVGRDNPIDVDGSRNREDSMQFEGREGDGKSTRMGEAHTGRPSNLDAKKS